MELSLELSIGGCYKNMENSRNHENEIEESNTSSKSDVSESYVVGYGKDEIFSSDSVYPSKKHEMQDLRRREAIKKREEKQKRWASRDKGGGVNVNERFYLEIEQNQARVVDREMRENEGCEKLLMKREKGNGVVPNMNGDNSFGNLVQPIGYDKCLKVFKNGNYCGDVNLGHRNQRVVPNGLIERSSSVLLDYQSTSQKAGSSSTDTGSHSNYSQGGQQQLIATASSDNPARSVLNCPSRHGRPDQANGKSPNLLLTMASSNIPSHECTDSQTCEPTTKKLKPTPKEQPSFDYGKCNEPVINPPIPQTSNQETAPLHRMPLVSTTGNGPNGKTVNGFLYNYSKSEVSIVCVCHGSSFSPAEFVEHAGGVDISHPLKHITIVPTHFG